MITQFDVSAGGGRAAARGPPAVSFESRRVADEKLAEMLPDLEREYREKAEQWVTFDADVAVKMTKT